MIAILLYLREVCGVEDAAGLPGGLLVPVHDAELVHDRPQVGRVGLRAQSLRQVARVELPVHAFVHSVRVQVQLQHGRRINTEEKVLAAAWGTYLKAALTN